MERKVDVTFSMSRMDLLFLNWMVSFQKSRPEEPRDLVRHWTTAFEQALEAYFPEGEDSADVPGTANDIRGDLERGQPLTTVAAFSSEFDTDGFFHRKDGSLRVIAVDPKDRRWLATLRFQDGRCVSFIEDVLAGWPRPEPSASGSFGGGVDLCFDDDARHPIWFEEGRVVHASSK